MTLKEFKQNFPLLYLVKKRYIDRYIGDKPYYSQSFKTENGYISHLKREEERLSVTLNAQKIQNIEIIVNWKFNKVFGYNPHVAGKIEYVDGSTKNIATRCTGAGCDKEVFAINKLLNCCARQMLYKRINSRKSRPSAITEDLLYKAADVRDYDEIAKYLGAKWVHVNRDSTDFYALIFS